MENAEPNCDETPGDNPPICLTDHTVLRGRDFSREDDFGVKPCDAQSEDNEADGIEKSLLP